MKPLKLSMTAFGPYADTQVLDFTELGDRTFFLVHGPTGSGKTTILDAICFALYGDTSGAERNGRQMRSDHADPALPTEISFDFAVGSETYRIKRNPEQERPKRSGGGTTIMRPNATMWKRTVINEGAEWTVLENGWNRVTEAVEKLLGFKSSQFRQVVILPQGEFRRLLTAGSGERQVILETLFRTELSHRIEEALKESAKRLQEDCKKLRAQKNWVLQEAKAESRKELEERRQAHIEQLKDAALRIDSCRKALKQAQERLQAGQQALERIKEKEKAENDLAGIESKIQEFDRKRNELTKARHADELSDVEHHAKFLRNKAEVAARNLSEKETARVQALRAKEEAEKTLAVEKEKEPQREAIGLKLARLEDLTGKVTALNNARKEVLAAREKASSAEKNYVEVQRSLNLLKIAIEEKTKIHGEVVNKGALAPSLEAAYKEAERLYEKRKNLERERREFTGIEKIFETTAGKYRQLQDRYTREKEKLTKLQEAWHKGQAAILAGSLTDGAPCPVCGSREHPAPAKSEVKLPSEEDIKTVQRNLTGLESARDRAQNELNNITANRITIAGKIKDLENELGKNSDTALNYFLEAVQKAKTAWHEAGQALEKASAIHNEIKKLKELEESTSERLEGLRREYEKKMADLEAALAVVRERESVVPADLREPAALIKARDEAANKRDRLTAGYERARKGENEAAQALVRAETAVNAASLALKDAVKQAEEAESAFQQRLREKGFKDRTEFEAARKTKEEMQSLEKEISAFDESLCVAKDRLARAVQAAEGLDEPNLEELISARDDAEKSKDNMITLEAELQKQIANESGWLKQLEDLENSLKELENGYEILGRISEVANGKNKYGVTFQRFVLGALLEDVTVAATERLKLMSRGRYHLQHTMDRSRSNAAGGLDLEVFDTYTGTARGVATLSGGETFLASLSLALGLADVVQSYSGGIHLDTIFVDEGFGTLDPESLDFAIRALIDLQKGGRLVGIISHVPELQERIDARLEVVPTKRGSVARFKLS